MKTCAELPTRQRDICEGRVSLPLSKINAYRRLWGLPPLDVPQGRKRDERTEPAEARSTHGDVARPAGCCGEAAAAVQPISTTGPGSLLLQHWRRLGAPTCAACLALAAQMDEWGPDGCRENLERIVEDVLPRARVWLQQKHPFVSRLLKLPFVSDVGDDIVRSRIRTDVLTAIQDAQNRNRNEFSLPPKRVWWSAFRPQPGTPRFVTSADLARDVAVLMKRIPHDVTCVAGVSRSGLYPASLVAMLLHVPLMVVRHHQGDYVPAGNGWRLTEGAPSQSKERHTLVVDDTVMTGNSTLRTRHVLRDLPGRKTYAAVYVNPAAKTKPDIWAVDLPWPHLLEWNLFNSIMATAMALDFDGILCEDCPPDADDDGDKYLQFLRTVRPKYLFRKRPIPMIVTARLEKYRRETTEWLRKWGMTCNNLIMHPANSKAERSRSDVARWKAEHFSRFRRTVREAPQVMFVESDPVQAARIADISGGLVVCPPAARCFGVP